MQATLGGGARNGERVAVKIHTGEEDKTIVLLCALRCVWQRRRIGIGRAERP